MKNEFYFDENLNEIEDVAIVDFPLEDAYYEDVVATDFYSQTIKSNRRINRKYAVAQKKKLAKLGKEVFNNIRKRDDDMHRHLNKYVHCDFIDKSLSLKRADAILKECKKKNLLEDNANFNDHWAHI